MVIHLSLGIGSGGAHAAQDDLPGLLAMDLEQRPERGRRRYGVSVLLTPAAVVGQEL
jgi:hypothetical protein